jgi:two-component system cell cycle sensor histidine kinase/response regulator CckA
MLALAASLVACESEDERQIREFLKDGLESLGYRVLLSADAGEAIELCGTPKDGIDVIVSDVILPGMNGPEFLKQVRELWPGAVRILMSGYAQDALSRSGIRESEAPLIFKPFEIADIAQLIRERIAEKSEKPAAAVAS